MALRAESLLVILGLLLSLRGLGACAPAGDGGRDVVPPSVDVVVDAAAPARSAEGYEYVARRRGAVVALAEARGIAPAVARAAVDHLADALDTCAAEHAAPEGAARIVVQVDAGGAVNAASLRVDPGAGVAETAVLCLVAPVKLLTFPEDEAGARGFAIEALWGRRSSAP